MQKIRQTLKNEMQSLLDLLIKVHRSELSGTEQQVLETLEQCQQAALTVGTTMEKTLQDHQKMVSILEEYCEELYQAAMDLSHLESHVAELDRLIIETSALLDQVETYLQIVFMPYKASMWDSLESIYLAAEKDPDCHCLVVPIPYFNMDQKRNKAELVYEGKEFPKNIPITHYQTYDLAAERPDVIYIHNPYDEYNIVTNIHPDYRSYELKKHTGCLVYVPYYVTAGFFSEEHRYLPVYRWMDYMIAQSEYFKEEAKGLPYYDRILPLGSPKFDKVIRICREEKKIPPQWQPLLEGKKAVMLNTSINCLLYDTDAMLKKLKIIFQYFSSHREVALIWRPHPLLEATLRSMRPDYEPEYKKLLEEFKEQKIGILDETPDMTGAIALSDAYIGENATSVVNLFGAAGKPLFILNNYIFEPFSDEEKRQLPVTAVKQDGDNLWILTAYGLFKTKDSWENAEYIKEFPQTYVYSNAFWDMAMTEGSLYPAPYMSMDIGTFPIGKGIFSKMKGPEMNRDCKFRKVISYRRKLFYLPQEIQAVLEFSLDDGQWKEHSECIQEWIKDRSGQRFETVYDAAAVGSHLYMTAADSHRILDFDMETGKFNFIEIGRKGLGFSGITGDSRHLWLAEANTGAVIHLDHKTGNVKVYEMPEGFHLAPTRIRQLAHSFIIDIGDWVVTTPAFSNAMVKIHKKSGRVSLLLPELLERPNKPVNGYSSHISLSVYWAARKDESRMWVQRCWDWALLEIDVSHETADIRYPSMAEESLAILEQAAGDGFGKIDRTAEFSRKESRFCSLEDFLADLNAGKLETVKVRQMEELKTLAANLDGSCGEKVHECIKRKCKSPADPQ